MDASLTAALRDGRGLVNRSDALRKVPPWVLTNACREGALVRAFPAVYVDAALVNDAFTRQRAALAYAGSGGSRGAAALSHTTALATWGLRTAEDGEPIHVTVPARVAMRARAGLVVHRVRGFAAVPPDVVTLRGLPVVRLERALVDAWGLLDEPHRREPVISAVSGRLTTPDGIAEALATRPTLPGRAELRRLLTLLAAGCPSPLEIWGYEREGGRSGEEGGGVRRAGDEKR